MKIVVDVNVIIAALLANSTTRKILLTADAEFYFPEASLFSLHKYEEELMQRSGLSREDYALLKSELLARVSLIPDEVVATRWAKAFSAMGSVDDEDATVLAGAIAINAVIWSQDKHFEKQDKIRLIKTAEMVVLFGDELD